MKKLLLPFFTLISFFTVNAQVNKTDNALAVTLIKANSKAIGLTDKDLNEVIISSTYLREQENLRMLYLQQSYKDIPVFNQMQVIAFKNGKLASVSGGRIPNIENLINNPSALPSVPAALAVEAALRSEKYASATPIVAREQLADKLYFGTLGIALNNINAHLVWLPVSGKQVRLTWEIDFAPLKSPDRWMIRVDAATAKVLDKNNLTVYENFDHASGSPAITAVGSENNTETPFTNSPSVVSSASYRVVPYPAESPNHPGGAPALVTDPWTLSSGNAVSLKWHYDGTTYFDSTRGNNVWAQEDRDNNNNTFGKTGKSTTAQPTLTFNYVPDFTQAPTTTTNQQQATTNLFYWNNLMHDISYLYGFDEVSGNFQANNQSRGGTGNDYVIADAQDAGGTSNANFSTPVDGQRPRMQMYLFTGTTPNRDGDLDNGVINHEYTHGISTRLTGGPANSSCLNNAEQGGEGWSDYFALMTTTKWSTAQVTDGALARPMGTYVLGQPTTGAGIRQHPYSTNMSIDPWTYANLATSGGEVHNIGEIWCTALWEMTWEMIQVDGINPNLFSPAATGGNSAALKLVLEGMRLQPCSPGYIDARNAILKADTIFYGARYSCAIWKAFAKRGMGKGASQGSSNSTTDQVASFIDNGGSGLLLTQNVTAQQEGLNIIYTNHVSAGTCGSLTNYLLTDTLPANVSYVSGGTYNSGNRVVSFPVNIAQNASQDYSFTVVINAGSYFAPATLLDEQVTGTAGTIPAAWTASSTTTTVWTTHNTRSHSAPNSFFTPNLAAASDQKLETTNAIALGSPAPVLSFWHWYNSEPGWDGGVVEISTNGGSSWTDLGARMTSGGYNSSLSASTNPLTGRAAFTGNSNAFVKTAVDLTPYANLSAKFRFRFGSDESVGATGWNVDDILLQRNAVVNMRSNLFTAQSARVSFSDTVTTILQSSCIAGTFSLQPSGATVCAGSNVSFNVSATGTAIVYQWQLSTDGGTFYTNIAGANSTTLSVMNVTVSMNNYRYRCQITGTCTASTNSNAALLTVNALPQSPAGIDGTRCGTGSVGLAATPANGETIDWYAAAAGGTALLTGANTFLTPVITSTTTYYAQARNTITGCIAAARTAVAAIVNASPVPASGTDGSSCGAGTVTVSATSGAGETIDWYAASTGGTALLSGSSSFTTPSISTTTTYYAEARNTATGCISSARTAVTATINALPLSPAGSGASGCGAGVLTITATSGAGETIDWYAASTGGTALLPGSSSFTTPSISATTTYYAEARNISTGCISSLRTAVTATINALPLSPAGNGASRCGAGVLTISATNGAGETIDWYAASTGGTALLSGSSSFTTSSLSTTTNYYAEARNTTTGCLSSARTAVTATVNDLPVNPQGTGGSGCSPSTVTLSASAATNETIDWYADATGGSAVAGGSFFTTPVLTASTTYYAEARNTITGCVSGSRTAVVATINASSSSTTFISICATALPYTWNNNTFNSGGTYTVTLVNAAGCDSLAKLYLDVAAAINVFNVTGGGSYTTGGAGVPVGVSGSEQGVNYQLLLNGNPTGSPVAGTNNPISFGNQLQAGTYTVLATTPLCQQAMSGTAAVSISSGPPAQFAVTGGGTYCSGTSGLAVGLAGSETGVSYQLLRSNGTISVGSPVQGTGSALTFGLQTIAADYSVRGTNTVSLATQMMLNSVYIRVAAARAPSIPGTITGPVDVCPYIGVSNVIYRINQAANATSYLWTAPSGATIIGSNTDTVVVIQYPSSFTSGTLSVASVNACFSNATSASRTLPVSKKVPATPGTITSSLPNPCSIVGTASTSTYTIRTVANATGYNWILSSGIVLVSSYGDTGIVVRFASGFTSGSVTVNAYNICFTSASRTLAVAATIPATPVSVNGPANVCSYVGQPTNATYTTAAVSGATSYLWTAPANSTIVSGQGSTSVQVSFAAGFVSGNITVKSVSGCGSSAARSLALGTAVAKPGVISASASACPSTSVTYSITAVPYATSYLWTVPVNAIYVSGQGTTSFVISYKPAFVSGSVTVKAINNCSTSAAASLSVSASSCAPPFAGRENTMQNYDRITVYPNPGNGIFNLSLTSTSNEHKMLIEMLDTYGKVVKQQTLNLGKANAISTTIYASELPAGVYELRCHIGNDVQVKKVIIMK